jgi:hypothetical protein
MKFVNDKNYLKMYNNQKHSKRWEITEFLNQDEIQAVLDAENVEDDEYVMKIDKEFEKKKLSKKDNSVRSNEDEEDRIGDDEDDDDNVIEEPEGEALKKFKQMLKHLLIIQYYKLPFNQYKFVFDEPYQEEIKGRKF